MSKDSFENTKVALTNSAMTLPERIPAGGELVSTIGRAWELMTADVERSLLLQSGLDFVTQAKFQGSLEDGLHVALFGLGQIVKQSFETDETIENDMLIARAVGSRIIFSALATRPKFEAVAIEDKLGFRSDTFYSPSERLHMYGTSVSSDSIDEIIPPEGLLTVSELGGCPFRKNLSEILPVVAENLVSVLAAKN